MCNTEPRARYLLEASLAEHDNLRSASNMKGLPVHARLGDRDNSVPPWIVRRMVRNLQEHGVAISLDEFHKGHWWWDSQRPNDGGVMYDDSIRKFIDKALKKRKQRLPPDGLAAPPPALPNVYTDGSFKNPRYPTYGAAGVGVWWPGRVLEATPLSSRNH